MEEHTRAVSTRIPNTNPASPHPGIAIGCQRRARRFSFFLI